VSAFSITESARCSFTVATSFYFGGLRFARVSVGSLLPRAKRGATVLLCLNFPHFWQFLHPKLKVSGHISPIFHARHRFRGSMSQASQVVRLQDVRVFKIRSLFGFYVSKTTDFDFVYFPSLQLTTTCILMFKFQLVFGLYGCKSPPDFTLISLHSCLEGSEVGK
jgi:hypothetical protein